MSEEKSRSHTKSGPGRMPHRRKSKPIRHKTGNDLFEHDRKVGLRLRDEARKREQPPVPS